MKENIYLLTGAAGFLGSNISRLLLSQGKKVRALVLKGDKARVYVPDGVEIVDGDLLDEASMDRFFDVDANTYDTIVLHVASWVIVDPEWNEKVKAVNVDGTHNLLDECFHHQVKKLVYVSSTGAIPELPQGQTITEVNHFDPDNVLGCYSKTKAMATQLVLDAVHHNGDFARETFDLDATIVHPSGICGPNDYAMGPFAKFICDAANSCTTGKLKTSGVAGTFNSVDVRDLADAVVAAVEKGRCGECYILSNDMATCADILHIIADEMSVKYAAAIAPAGAAKFAAFCAEMAGKITGKKPFFTRFSIYNLTRNNNFSSDKAKKELGFKTRPFAESIRDCVRWMRAEGKIKNVKADNGESASVLQTAEAAA
jgi:dihydroflavonol-4-reductase